MGKAELGHRIQLDSLAAKHFTCLCAWASEYFFQGGHYWILPKVFLRGAKSSEICFLPLEISKTAFLAEIFKFLPLFGYACV